MEHDEKPLPIDIRKLGDISEKCQAYAKAPPPCPPGTSSLSPHLRARTRSHTAHCPARQRSEHPRDPGGIV